VAVPESQLNLPTFSCRLLDPAQRALLNRALQAARIRLALLLSDPKLVRELGGAVHEAALNL
jgi:hypothetical protein